MNSAWLLVSSLISLMGTVVCLYGWRQRLVVPTLVGVALMGYPYFVSGVGMMIAIGVVLLGLLVAGTRIEDSG